MSFFSSHRLDLPFLQVPSPSVGGSPNVFTQGLHDLGPNQELTQDSSLRLTRQSRDHKTAGNSYSSFAPFVPRVPSPKFLGVGLGH